MDENMETVQAEIENAWAENETVTENPEPETRAQENAEQTVEPAQQEPAQQEEPKADQPELFTLKNRDETKQVTRDELVAMAQKGWDYDHIREERDQLRQYRQEADPALELVKSYAQRSGMNVADYLDYCRRQELMAKGMTEQDAAQKVTMEKERAELDRQKAEIEAVLDRQRSAERRANELAQARQKDIESFYRAYPNVDPKSIPQEVWGEVKGGDTLTNAYTRYENRRLQAELAAERQNRDNRAKAPGSLGGSPGDDDASLISRYCD